MLLFAQYVVFVLLWFMLLASVYIVTYTFVLNRYRLEREAHLSAAFTTSCIVFELALRVQNVNERTCTWLQSLYSSICSGSVWSLNPLSVLFSLLGDIVVLAANVFGRSCAVFVRSILEELPFLIAIPSLLIILITIFSAAFIVAGYGISIGYGFLKLTPRPVPLLRNSVAFRDPPSSLSYYEAEECILEKQKSPPMSRRIAKIDELYMKSET